MPFCSHSLCLTLLYLTHTAHTHTTHSFGPPILFIHLVSGFYSAPCAAARCLVSSLSYVFSCLLRECGSIEETPIANSHRSIESQAWNCTAATGTWIANQLPTASRTEGAPGGEGGTRNGGASGADGGNEGGMGGRSMGGMSHK